MCGNVHYTKSAGVHPKVHSLLGLPGHALKCTATGVFSGKKWADIRFGRDCESLL